MGTCGEFDPNKRGIFQRIENLEESKLLNVVLAILLMLALVGMLGYMISK